MTFVIGTAGHVDHGKSTLVEALTGIDPDRLAEEKEREMTIDLGFAWLTLPGGQSVGIVDVPGHRDFIENMLAGVGGIDLALFVIAADEGVMPQSREHLAILDLLEVSGGVVALTKIDIVQDPDWIDLVMVDVEELLEGTSLEGAPLVPVSAWTGEGLDNLLTIIEDALADCTPQADRGRPRLPIDRVFTISGFGTVVTGTLTGGRLGIGDEVEVQPSGRKARVRGLQSHKEEIELAVPGSRVAVNLSGVDKEDIERGDVVAVPGLLRSTTLIDVQFRYLESVGRVLDHNAEVKFYSGAAESLAYVRLIGDKVLSSGADGWLQLRLTDFVALDKGDRYILRYPSPPQTIGGGIVLDSHPPHRWRRFKPEVIERFETLSAGTPDEVLLHTLESQVAMTPGQLSDQTGLPREEVDPTLDKLSAEDEIILLTGGWIMARTSWGRLAERIEREIRAYHAEYPLRVGMPREALRSRVELEGKLFNEAARLAEDAGIAEGVGTVLRRPGHKVTFSEKQQAAIEDLLAQIAANPVNTPSAKEAALLVGEDVLAALIARGDVVQVENDVLFAPETYKWLVNAVIDHIQTNEAITVAEARDIFGTSRKYVLGLLEYLDGEGITRRVEDRRVMGPSAARRS